uniref:Uncharacterized protein n=1 Tax=Rhodopseudomonas palustris (strain BisA53) TaxID=316055 RepID=Q07NA5_RHOP5
MSSRAVVAAVVLSGLMLLIAAPWGGARAQAQSSPMSKPNSTLPNSTLEEGKLYSGTVRFEERDWPLPEGQWELLAHIPFQNSASGSWAIRVALARFEPERRLRAIIVFSTGEGQEHDAVTAGRLPACQAVTPAFAGERQIVDDAKDFSCWRIMTMRPDEFSASDPVFAALRVKLAALQDAPPAFMVLHGVIKKDRRATYVTVLFDPVQLQMAPGSPDLLASFFPNRLKAQDGWEGTRLDVLMMLRAWANRWYDGVWSAFAGRSAAEGRGPGLPLPVLRNPHGPTPTAPNMALRVGTSFEERLNSGPFVVPLPPGSWTVMTRTPHALPNGALIGDSVMLANLDGGLLRGFVQIEYRPVHPAGPEADKVCQGKARPILSRDRPDTYCATATLTDLGPAHRRDPFDEELALRGIELPKMTLGAEAVYSNRAMVMRVLVQFSPRHIGLPEPGERDARGFPIAWAPFRLKWAAFVQVWAQAVEAGLTGGLGPGPFPAKWRDLDLHSESFAASVAPNVGETYRDTVPLGGRHWPLPRGEWTVLANVPRMERDEVVEDQVYLASLSSAGVEGIVGLSFTRPDLPLAAMRILAEPAPICRFPGRLFSEQVQLDLGLRQDCWSLGLDHLMIARHAHGYAGFEAAVRARGAQLPERQIAARYVMATRDRALTAVYAFPWAHSALPKPERQGAMAAAEPAETQGGADALKNAASDVRSRHEEVRRWVSTWHDAVKDGFDGKLSPGALPAPWKDSHPITHPAVP